MAIKSISRIISQLANQDPDRPAISCENRTVSRRQLDLRTNRLARAYHDFGVTPNDFVTIALPNSIEFYESCIAVWKLGATPQPVSSRLPQIEREAIIELANAKLVVGAEPGSLGDRHVLPVGFEPDSCLSDEELPDCVSTYFKAMCTGGSTGHPKLIVSKDPGELDMENEGFAMIHMVPNKTHLQAGPVYHSAPFVMSVYGLLTGNHIVLMPRFEAKEALQLIERFQIDYVSMVPTMMHRIWRLGVQQRNKYDLSCLRIAFHFAAPCPAWLKEAWINWLGPERIHEMYGATEGTGMTWITGDEWLSHRGSVGKPIDGSQIKIIGKNGKSLHPGEVGEVYQLPAGGQGSTYQYVGADSDSIEGGWESVGDMGWLDEEGYLYLADRKTDMIISGGANIYPAEVEAAIDSHPAVRSSVVIGLPDDDLGQVVHGIVDAPKGVTEAELIDHLTEQLVRYKIPRSVEFAGEPLRDDAGKVRRSALLAARVMDGKQ